MSDSAGYPLGSVPTAGCSTTDALSGVATQATLSVSGGGGPLGADGTGTFTATCSGATDNAGNSGSASATYSVLYSWSGFFQPVDNLPTVNTVNAGQAIPVKFSLGGDYGLNIFASGYPKVQTVSCGSGGSGSSDPIEETVTAGNSTLQYNATTQTYTYVWKTDKAWAGTCRQLIVKLIDGSEHIALFQFNGKVHNAASDSEGDAVVTQSEIFLPLVNR
ncbi:MAG: PxKF domain-containing protein [Caldilineaceae bacterium]